MKGTQELDPRMLIYPEMEGRRELDPRTLISPR